jgi:leucyl/phenylalanyl-tRNA--protein transferase
VVDGRRDNTWILPELMYAYTDLHNLGYAHSIEVWAGSDLVGGLYGVRVGKVFFGESMFSRSADGSKMALIALSHVCSNSGVVLIDGQVENPHLMNMGATLLSRLDFENILGQNVHSDIDQSQWRLPEQTQDLA